VRIAATLQDAAVKKKLRHSQAAGRMHSIIVVLIKLHDDDDDDDDHHHHHLHYHHHHHHHHHVCISFGSTPKSCNGHSFIPLLSLFILLLSHDFSAINFCFISSDSSRQALRTFEPKHGNVIWSNNQTHCRISMQHSSKQFGGKLMVAYAIETRKKNGGMPKQQKQRND
jgi:hypothetical protein